MELMATPKTNEFLCDGVKLKVRSLDSLMSIEPGGIEVDGEITNKLTQEDYYSMLCNNLGFDAYNDDFDQYKVMDICNMNMDCVHTYPLTSNILWIKKLDSLYNVLCAISNWGSAEDTEYGRVLDISETYNIDEGLRESLVTSPFAIDFHPMEVKKGDTGKGEVFSWLKCDIFSKRLHNLHYEIDKEYYRFCFKDFVATSKKININNTHVMFALGISDPDLLFDIIRTAEIRAAKYAASKKYNGKFILLKDEDMLSEFVLNFNKIYTDIVEYVKQGGLTAIKAISAAEQRLHIQTYLELQYDGETGDLMTVDERKEYIKNISIEVKDINQVNSCFDISPLPNNPILSVSKDVMYKRLIQFINASKDDGDIRAILPVNQNDTPWVIEPGLFKNGYLFGFFSYTFGKVLIFDEDMSVKIMSPADAIKYYNDKGIAAVLTVANSAAKTGSPRAGDTVIAHERMPFDGTLVLPVNDEQNTQDAQYVPPLAPTNNHSADNTDPVPISGTGNAVSENKEVVEPDFSKIIEN